MIKFHNKRNYAFILILLGCLFTSSNVFASNPFKKDWKSKEIKYKYQVQKDDLEYKRDNRLINRIPSGYMTVDEYERQSEFKDKTTIKYDIPKIEKPSDFKYIPQPLYKIVKYNDPPGSPELSLGKKLYTLRQINAQGIVSPDYTKMVYPAVYYYTDTGSVATDLFLVPLDTNESNLSRILKANIGKRDTAPIMSTDKVIDNFEAFRTLTPVDFNFDGSKLLVKEKLGSEQDGIWKTRIYVYDFAERKEYNLSVIHEAISYFWKEYKNVELIKKRWDIVPLGFDQNDPDRVIVQAYGFTGEKPVYLGAWSIDSKGNQTRLVSFDRDYQISVSSNGFKIDKDGVKAYVTVQAEEKMQKKEDKIIEKQKKALDKKEVKLIKEDYKYELKDIKADYKDEYRDNRKLQTLKGSTEGIELEQQYYEYQQKQTEKDIKKYEKQIQNKQKQIDKIDTKIQKTTEETQNLIDNKLNKIYGTSDKEEEEEENSEVETNITNDAEENE